MITAKLEQFFENARRKGFRDRGVILISTILMFTVISATIYGMMASSGRTTKSASLSRDFIEAGQMADYAVQDAIYQLNEKAGAALPAAGAPKTGTVNNGTWQWSAAPVTSTAGYKHTVISAQGTFRTATRKVTVTAGALNVSGFKVQADKQITYNLSPTSAFNHTIMGSSVTVQNGVSSGATFLAGTVGMLGSTLATDPAAGTTSAPDADYLLYGAAASQAPVQQRVTRVPIGLALDSSFITANTAYCTALEAWKASEHGGQLVANGNTGCFSSMTFDVPTQILGTGAFNAFVTGDVIFSDNVSAPNGTGLNIYTAGNVAFRTQDASGSSLNLANTYIYAPSAVAGTGKCSTVPFRSNTKPLNFTGSIACGTVAVAGTFGPGLTAAGTPGVIDPLGSSAGGAYDTDIWYLADYKQPSGTSIAKQ